MLMTEKKRWGDFAWRHLPGESIRRIRVTRVGFVTPSSWWIRYRADSDGKTFRFRVPAREATRVSQVLHNMVGDRFEERPSRRLSALEIGLIGVGALSLVLILIGLGIQATQLSAGAALVLEVAVCLGIVGFLLRDASEFKLEKPPRARRRKRRAGRRPFRSRILGWGLKLASVACCALPLLTVAAASARRSEPEAFGLIGLVLVTSAFVWIPVSLGLLILGARLSARTFDPGRHPDPRPPVLFLRAFDDDGRKTFQPTTRLAKLHGVSRLRDLITVGQFAWLIHPTVLLKTFLNAETYSAEELLRLAFRRFGPFVAIGRPGELLATSGADRMYVPDADWKTVVLDYLSKSTVVILQPSKTAGVRWEIEQVFHKVPRDRVLLSMLNYKGRPGDYEEFRSFIAENHGVQLPVSLPFLEMPSVVYFESNGSVTCQRVCYRSPLLWTFTANAVDVDRTFGSFAKGLQGGPRPSPRAPKLHFGHTILSYYSAYLLPFVYVVVLIFAVQIMGTILAWCLEFLGARTRADDPGHPAQLAPPINTQPRLVRGTSAPASTRSVPWGNGDPSSHTRSR
jgi:hypothetical protein